jgi:hypothetical protein
MEIVVILIAKAVVCRIVEVIVTAMPVKQFVMQLAALLAGYAVQHALADV